MTWPHRWIPQLHDNRQLGLKVLRGFLQSGRHVRVNLRQENRKCSSDHYHCANISKTRVHAYSRSSSRSYPEASPRVNQGAVFCLIEKPKRSRGNTSSPSNHSDKVNYNNASSERAWNTSVTSAFICMVGGRTNQCSSDHRCWLHRKSQLIVLGHRVGPNNLGVDILRCPMPGYMHTAVAAAAILRHVKQRSARRPLLMVLWQTCLFVVIIWLIIWNNSTSFEET